MCTRPARANKRSRTCVCGYACVHIHVRTRVCGQVCADVRVRCVCANTRVRGHVCAVVCVRTYVSRNMCGERGDRAGGKSRDETATSARATATPTPLHENRQIEAATRQTGEVRHWPRCHRQHCSRCHFHRRPRRMTWGTNNAAATLTVMQAICKDEHRRTPLKAEMRHCTYSPSPEQPVRGCPTDAALASLLP